MAVLADLERLLERIFERSTARLFRAHPQAVQVERRVERAMERARVATAGRTMVPARYRVRLHPDDLADVAGASGGPEALAGRLADASLAFARSHGYQLPGRPSVALIADPAVDRGVIEVDALGRPPPAEATPPPTPDSSVRAMPVPDVPVIAPRPTPPARDDPGVPVSVPVPVSSPGLPGPAPAVSAGAGGTGGSAEADIPPAAGPEARGGIRGDGDRTMVFRKPAPVPTRAVLRVVTGDGSERTVEVDGTPLTLGRAGDNGLVLADPRVSRHHARLQARRGTLVLTDLGSTNGSRVNGVRVDECVLGSGDRVVLGDTVLLVEQLPG